MCFEKANVCFEKENVCFQKANVCFEKANVCFQKANVCFQKANVCFEKANVCFVKGKCVCLKRLISSFFLRIRGVKTPRRIGGCSCVGNVGNEDIVIEVVVVNERAQ